MTGIEKAKERYKRWWAGRFCKTKYRHRARFKKVVDVEVFGSPSFVYGTASLIFADGTSETIYQGDAYVPRKRDVEVREDNRASRPRAARTMRNSSAA